MAAAFDSANNDALSNTYDLRSKSPRGKNAKEAKKFTSDEYTSIKENGYASSNANRDTGASMQRLSKSKVDLAERRAAEREERHGLVVWRRPVTTLYYFLLECLALLHTSSAIKYFRTNRRTVVAFILPILAAVVSLVGGVVFHFYHTESSSPYHEHVQDSLKNVQRTAIWCLYWIGLGVLSSIGLGTGLHTFLLYLGPHIAAVTLAAYECNSVKFPEPPYPDDIICPYENGIAGSLESTITKHLPGHHSKDAVSKVNLFVIMQKVWLEAFMWGLGTAIGELPPYFLALHARATTDQQSEDLLAVPSATSSIGQFNKDSALRAANTTAADGEDDDDEDDEEEKPSSGRRLQAIANRGRILVEQLVQKVGFFGILICASIPNPLFDLAGITCGHFQVPFWKFFGATMIGKAIIKMSIQMLFVIVTFSEHHFEKVCKMLRNIPYAGPIIYEPFREFLVKQKQNLHRKPGKHGAGGEGGNKSWLKFLYEYLVYFMIGYFIISIINGFAQSYHRRLHAPAGRSSASRLRLSGSGLNKSYSNTKAASTNGKKAAAADEPVRNGSAVKENNKSSSKENKRVSPASSQQKKSNNNSKQRSGSRKVSGDTTQSQKSPNTSVEAEK